MFSSTVLHGQRGDQGGLVEVDVDRAEQPAQRDHVAEEVAAELARTPSCEERDLLGVFARLGQADVGTT